MKAIVHSIKPTIVTLNEHLMVNKKGPSIQGYKCFNSMRKTSMGGGIATLIKSCDSEHTLKSLKVKMAWKCSSLDILSLL